MCCPHCSGLLYRESDRSGDRTCFQCGRTIYAPVLRMGVPPFANFRADVPCHVWLPSLLNGKAS